MRSSILQLHALWTLDSRSIVTQLSNENEVESSQPWISDSIVMQSRRHGGALVGLDPQNKAPRPPNLKYEML